MLKILTAFLIFPFSLGAQNAYIDLFAGMANYQGDLNQEYFTTKSANFAGAVSAKFGITDKLYGRVGLTIGKLSADDIYNAPQNRPRNLNFTTSLQEFTFGLDYHFFKMDPGKISPYLLGGAGVFHFNPYTFYNDGTGNKKYYLQPLGTEGEGLAAYPDRKPYKLFQFCVYYGIGIKYQFSGNLNIGVEFRQSKSFTDYIDDVSTTYVNEDALRAAHGQIAVDLAWRIDEYNGRPYPTDDPPRGNSKKDLYYFAGLTVGFRLFNTETGKFFLGGILGSGKPKGYNKSFKSQVACPKF